VPLNEGACSGSQPFKREWSPGLEFGRDFKILQSRVHNLNIGMSVDQFKSVWESLISILLDGNTEAAFSAE